MSTGLLWSSQWGTWRSWSWRNYKHRGSSQRPRSLRGVHLLAAGSTLRNCLSKSGILSTVIAKRNNRYWRLFSRITTFNEPGIPPRDGAEQDYNNRVSWRRTSLVRFNWHCHRKSKGLFSLVITIDQSPICFGASKFPKAEFTCQDLCLSSHDLLFRMQVTVDWDFPRCISTQIPLRGGILTEHESYVTASVATIQKLNSPNTDDSSVRLTECLTSFTREEELEDGAWWVHPPSRNAPCC